MESPNLEIEGYLAAHANLAGVAAGLKDESVHRPSLLPEWTVAHVLTHLARNAEAMHRRIEAASRGEQIDQYEGGAEGRATSIEAGTRRNARELVADVVDWSQRQDMAFASLPADGWSLMVRSLAGSEYPISAAENGHRFAWHMKLRDKHGTVTFHVTSDGEMWQVDPAGYLGDKQLQRLPGYPDRLVHFARFLSDQHGGAEVTAETMVSMNGREPQPIVDPTVDLSAVDTVWFRTPSWIVPLEQPLRR